MVKDGKRLKAGLRKLGSKVKATYAKRGEYVAKARAYRDTAYKKGREIQKKAQYLQQTYPVFGGTEELFGFNQPQKAALKSPDLLGNVGGVGTIDFGLGDYAPRTKPVIQGVDAQAIQKEMFEHPWASRQVAAQIAKDHKKRRKR